MRTEYLKHFTEQFAYPAEARDSLLRDYAAVCGRENAPVKRVPDLKNEEVLKLMGEETANGI